MTARLLVLALALAPLVGCSNPGAAACQKARECCARVSACEDINKEGEGFEDRCGIEFSATVELLGTYASDACKEVAQAYDDYVSCFAGVECADISDKGEVAACDAAAKAYCEARKASGDACGHDFGNLNCDDAKGRYLGP